MRSNSTEQPIGYTKLSAVPFMLPCFLPCHAGCRTLRRCCPHVGTPLDIFVFVCLSVSCHYSHSVTPPPQTSSHTNYTDGPWSSVLTGHFLECAISCAHSTLTATVALLEGNAFITVRFPSLMTWSINCLVRMENFFQYFIVFYYICPSNAQCMLTL